MNTTRTSLAVLTAGLVTELSAAFNGWFANPIRVTATGTTITIDAAPLLAVSVEVTADGEGQAHARWNFDGETEHAVELEDASGAARDFDLHLAASRIVTDFEATIA